MNYRAMCMNASEEYFDSSLRVHVLRMLSDPAEFWINLIVGISISCALWLVDTPHSGSILLIIASGWVLDGLFMHIRLRSPEDTGDPFNLGVYGIFLQQQHYLEHYSPTWGGGDWGVLFFLLALPGLMFAGFQTYSGGIDIGIACIALLAVGKCTHRCWQYFHRKAIIRSLIEELQQVLDTFNDESQREFNFPWALQPFPLEKDGWIYRNSEEMGGSLKFCPRVKLSYDLGWDAEGNPLLSDPDLTWRMGYEDEDEDDYESSDQWGYQWEDQDDWEDEDDRGD